MIRNERRRAVALARVAPPPLSWAPMRWAPLLLAGLVLLVVAGMLHG